MVDPLDHVAGRVEDEDRLRHRVEDLPKAICRLERPGVLDGGPGACREIDGELQMAWSEHPSGLGARECDGPEDPARRGHRRAHPRPQLQRLDQGEVFLVARGRPDHGLVDLGDDHRVARSRDGVCADRRVRVGWIPATKLLDQCDPIRVAVGDRDRSQRPIRVEQVDRTPIRDTGDDQIGDLAERRRAIEGRAEDAARIRHERCQRHVVRVADGCLGRAVHRPPPSGIGQRSRDRW